MIVELSSIALSRPLLSAPAVPPRATAAVVACVALACAGLVGALAVRPGTAAAVVLPATAVYSWILLWPLTVVLQRRMPKEVLAGFER